MELKRPFISAASGLVEIDGKFFVIADDENFIGIYDLETQSGVSVDIFNESLPAEKSLRKKNKRDFEALVHLPKQKQVLLVPSGSTINRERGALISEAGVFQKEFSFHIIFSELRKHFPEINIEGGVVVDEQLWLFQRGNGLQNLNGLIKLNLADFLANKVVQPEIVLIDLGAVQGTNLTFTDATKADKNILFLAVAENSLSTYDDGSVMGSILGIMGRNGDVICTTPLATTSKPEGLCYSSSKKCFYLVTDDDNRQYSSILLRGNLPAEWMTILIS